MWQQYWHAVSHWVHEKIIVSKYPSHSAGCQCRFQTLNSWLMVDRLGMSDSRVALISSRWASFLRFKWLGIRKWAFMTWFDGPLKRSSNWFIRQSKYGKKTTLCQYSSIKFDSTFEGSNCRPTTRGTLISFPISTAIAFATLKILANSFSSLDCISFNSFVKVVTLA